MEAYNMYNYIFDKLNDDIGFYIIINGIKKQLYIDWLCFYFNWNGKQINAFPMDDNKHVRVTRFEPLF